MNIHQPLNSQSKNGLKAGLKAGLKTKLKTFTLAGMIGLAGLFSESHALDIAGKVIDSAGNGISSAKVYLQSDSTQFTTSALDGTFHLSATVSVFRPTGNPQSNGLSLTSNARHEYYLQSPKAATVSVLLSGLDGRTITFEKQFHLNAGANGLDNLFKNRLPEGFYILQLKGDGLSLTTHLQRFSLITADEVQATPYENRPAAKVAATAATDDVPTLVVTKSGMAPMIYVPSHTAESGVNVVLKTPLTKIGHVIVIYLENWSFDALYGEFAGAEGLSGTTQPQRDTNGVPYITLPRPWNSSLGVADSAFPANLPNKPFLISNYKAMNQLTPDLVHRYYQEQLQIDGGNMDQFAAVSDARGMTMGYWHTDSLPLAAYAKQYTLCDHFFHSAFGGSFLNHQWLIAARTPLWSTIPSKYRATIDSTTGKIKKTADRTFADGQATPDGYIVNTIYTHNTPHPTTAATDQLVPDLTIPTIGDRLNDKGINWAWYSGGWNKANATPAVTDSNFQFHHQPFAYYANYADGTPGKAAHLKDETDMMAAIKNGTLPPVTFYKPVGNNNEHPGYADLRSGELHTKALLDSIKASSIWNDAVVIVTYDEHGGQHDHVAPPTVDKWGPGSRIPAIIISPYAKTGYVDHTVYETVSILSLIERRFSLVPLSSRDAKAGDLTNALTGL